MAITTAHKLLTEAWTEEVEIVETAVRRFRADHAPSHDCRVVLFERARDRHLHVNVTHRHPTAGVSGWAGPGSLPEGHVHNRLFGTMAPSRIIRHIHDMVFAPRV